MIWGTLDDRGGVREACLAVLGAGRTAMLFVSEPDSDAEPEGDVRAAERSAAITAARTHVEQHLADRVRILQALPEPDRAHAIAAFDNAGFIRVGELAQLRASLAGDLVADPEPWPAGVSVRTTPNLARGSEDRRLLAVALERSYEHTLDCPELCGLREIEDVIDAHRAAGVWDPSLWWVLLEGGEPAGCVLLNPSPPQRAVELVYLGLAPSARGRGLGGALLRMGLRRCRRPGITEVGCAVDRRNTPARALYDRLGFHETGSRLAMVRPIAPPRSRGA